MFAGLCRPALRIVCYPPRHDVTLTHAHYARALHVPGAARLLSYGGGARETEVSEEADGGRGSAVEQRGLRGLRETAGEEGQREIMVLSA